jgi:hypothetical protein
MRRRWLALLFLLAGAAPARDLVWQSLDRLGAGDRALAEQTLYEMWGEDPDHWPEWIDPAALTVPAGNGQLLIVRRPLRAPCGQYGFAVFSPVTPDRRRDKLGDFCAGDLSVIAVPGRDLPDLLVAEGRMPGPDGVWHRLDQRLRWQDGKWWRVLKGE